MVCRQESIEVGMLQKIGHLTLNGYKSNQKKMADNADNQNSGPAGEGM